MTNDINAALDVFVRDLQTRTTTNGNALASFSLTADGRYVAAARFSPRELFVWDAQARDKVYSTLSAAESYGFVLSSDGRTLVFPSLTNANYAIIAHDLAASADRTIGYTTVPTEPKAQFSGNGRFVTFVSAANAPNAPQGTNDIFLYDLQSSTTTLVSFNRDRTGGGNGPSDSPSISADGRFVTYRSAAADLVAVDNNNQPDVFLFDRLSGTNTLISVNQTGNAPGDDWSETPVISADGSTIVFKSFASDLVEGDLNGSQDVFLYRVSGVALLDTDGDGMTDAVEQAYFGNLTHNGSDDTDGDGVNDWMELRAGTDPMNRNSLFSPRAAVSPGTGQITINWETAPGRSYVVQYKDNLSQSNWNDMSGVTVCGSHAVCWDTWTNTGSQRFYRVRIVE